MADAFVQRIRPPAADMRCDEGAVLGRELFVRQGSGGVSSERFGYDEAPVPLEGLHHVPVVLSRGCANLFLQACDARALHPEVLSICTTRTAALVWAQENRACAVVPKQSDSRVRGLRTHPPVNPPLSVYRSPVIVRDRPLTKVAYNFLRFHNYLPADLL